MHHLFDVLTNPHTNPGNAQPKSYATGVLSVCYVTRATRRGHFDMCLEWAQVVGLRNEVYLQIPIEALSDPCCPENIKTILMCTLAKVLPKV
jgi:hypothetical protein